MSAGAGRILVAGGGIAGLTAALAFARRGFEVALFERAAAFEEIGAGLQLSPNATRILRRLGVLEDLLQVRAVDGEIGRAPALFRRLPERDSRDLGQGRRRAKRHRLRLHGQRQQVLEHAEAAQDARRVG